MLIGDSGEQDPEIYASLLRERSDQIAHVFIRGVRNETREAERLQAAFTGLDPKRWDIYVEPAEIREKLASVVRAVQK